MAGVTVSDEQLKDALKAMDVCLLNGVIGLSAILRRRGLLDDAEVATMHDWLTQPLSTEDRAENPAVQMIQSHIDELFAGLLQTG